MTGNTTSWKVALFADFMAYVGHIEVPADHTRRTCAALNSNAKKSISHNGGQAVPSGYISLKDVHMYHKVKNGSKLQYKLAETVPYKNVHKDDVFMVYDWLDNPGDDTEKQRQINYEQKYRNMRPQRMNIITQPFEGRNYSIEADVRNFYTQDSQPDTTFIPLANVRMQPLEWLVAQEHQRRPLERSFIGLNKGYIQSY